MKAQAPLVFRCDYQITLIDRDRLKSILKEFNIDMKLIGGNMYILEGDDVSLDCEIIDINRVINSEENV